MRDSSRNASPPIEAGDFFVLRSPLLPLDDFLKWGDGLEASRAVGDPDALGRALDADRRRLRTRLVELLDRPAVKEALFVASPAFSEAQAEWSRDPHSARSLRLESAAVRYFARMTSRATPFGLFAGNALGRIGGESNLDVGSWQSCRRHARLDMDYLAELTQTLARAPSIRNTLRYRPNATLYETAGRLRYAESATVAGVRSYQLVAVEATPDLTRVLRRAASGATLAELSQALVDEDITLEEARQYLEDLVDAQLLLPEFALAVTGEEPLADLIAQCGSHPALDEARTILTRAHQTLSELDEMPLGVDTEVYRQIHEHLSTLPVTIDPSGLYRVEMTKRDTPVLAHDVVAEIINAVELVHGMRDAGTDTLRSFREQFVERYERQEVPLLEVLDEDTGIAFGQGGELGLDSSPLLQGLLFPQATGEAPAVPQNSAQTYLLTRLAETLQTNQHVVVLSASELRRYRPMRANPLPETFSVVATIAAASRDALAQGDFIVVFGSAAGPSGATLLGRFCHADSTLAAQVVQHCRDEEAEHPDAVYAEVAHLPDGRAGNIVARPLLRDHEIPVLSRSGADRDRQIPLHDLLVSVRGDRVVLTSRRLGREVIPRLTTAHNFGAHSLGLYRFLCRLQYQQTSSRLFWTWGTLDSAPFLPRVVVGKVVLSKARWRVEHPEFASCLADDEATTFQRLTEWRMRRRIPRHVCLVEPLRDPLLYDLDNILSVRALVEAARRRRSLFFEECYPSFPELCSAAPEGRFVHEVIVPLACRREAPAVPARAPRIHVPVQQRYFAPGSEWLYAKIYTGTATADHVLREAIAPLIDELRDGIDCWFFVRYGDPRWHVRLRVQGAPSFLTTRLLPRLSEVFASLNASRAASVLQLDTYQREIERYGGLDAMRLAERAFHINSEAVLQSLEAYHGHDDAVEMWKIALLGMERMLEDLGIDLEERLRLARRCRSFFLRQLGVDSAAFRDRLGSRFRRERSALEDLVTHATRGDGIHGSSAGRILATHSARFRTEVAEPLDRLAAGGGLTESRIELATAYLHMHINRFVRSANVPHELVLYDFLARLYESRLARAGRRVARDL